MALFKHKKSYGQPQSLLTVLRSDLSDTDWSIHPSRSDDIMPFLTDATAALEGDPGANDYCSRLSIPPSLNVHGSYNTILPVRNVTPKQQITKSELKLLTFLKETGVLPRAAGLEELCQWGQSHNLLFRGDLAREGKDIFKNEVTTEVLPGVKVVVYEGGVAHAAARAAKEIPANPDGSKPIGRSEQRLLSHLKSTGALPQQADFADLCLWGRSHGMYRRIDLQTAGKRLTKSLLAQEKDRARAAAHSGGYARVEKSTARESSTHARLRRAEEDDSPAWLQTGGQVDQHATIHDMSSLQPGPEAEHTPRAIKDRHATTHSGCDRDDTSVPGMAERLAGRAGFKSTIPEPSPPSDHVIGHWHGSETPISNGDVGRSGSQIAAQTAPSKKPRHKAQSQLNALKARSLIGNQATVENLSAWKQANVVGGESWDTTLKRVVKARAQSGAAVSFIDSHVQILSPDDLDSSEPRHQLAWAKKQGLLTLEKSVQDMFRWREAHAKEGEKFSDFCKRMLALPQVPSSSRKRQLQRLQNNGFLRRNATVEDMLRWRKANTRENESLRAAIKRLKSGQSVDHATNLAALAQAERDHADGVLQVEWQKPKKDESGSEDEDMQIILEYRHLQRRQEAVEAERIV